jgi:hypothetical protein
MPAGNGLGQSQLPNSLQHASEFRRGRKTHGSIRVQEGEPIKPRVCGWRALLPKSWGYYGATRALEAVLACTAQPRRPLGRLESVIWRRCSENISPSSGWFRKRQENSGRRRRTPASRYTACTLRASVELTASLRQWPVWRLSTARQIEWGSL